MTGDQIELRAFHEAGHATIAHALGTPVKIATLDGVTTLVRVGCPQAQRAEALIALSGPLAEDRYQSYSLDEQAALWGSAWWPDLRNALHRLQAGESLGEAVREARQLVRQNWSQIKRLAQALHQRGELTAAEIDAVVRMSDEQRSA